MFDTSDDNLSTPLTISYPSNIGNLLGEGLRIAELVRKERGSYFVCQWNLVKRSLARMDVGLQHYAQS